MDKPKAIGAIWKKQGNNGEWLSIEIEIGGVKHRFAAFTNSYKKEDKHPDYRIMPPRDVSKPLQEALDKPSPITDTDVPF